MSIKQLLLSETPKNALILLTYTTLKKIKLYTFTIIVVAIEFIFYRIDYYRLRLAFGGKYHRLRQSTNNSWYRKMKKMMGIICNH